jgi:hypothetical protein
LPDSTLAVERLEHVADNLPYYDGGRHLHAGLTRRALGLPPVERPLAGHFLGAGDGSVWRTLNERGTAPDLLLHERGGRVERVPLRDHLEFARINTLLEDHEGSLWVGTDRGVLQVIQPGVTSLETPDGRGDDFILPVLRSKDDALWVGSWGGGLHRFANGVLERHYTTADGLPSPHIRALYESSGWHPLDRDAIRLGHPA